MKKIILIALLLLAGASLSYAQQRVTGKVTSKDDGQPVSFATVTVKGTTVATSTTNDGDFEITVPAGGTTLTVSFIGMISQDVEIAGRSIINVVLESEGVMLEESVVTAMGIKKERKALGYSVSEINSAELMKNKQTNVVNSLAGKIPGVSITQAGGAAGAGSNITIRGGNSASESRDNQPLFVVDGIIYDNTTVNAGGSGTDGVTTAATTFSNRVMDINPEDIESMSVLKGAAAAALYGSRAADGVIIITTKKGEEGSAKVSYSTKATYSWVKETPNLQSVYGRGSYNQAGAFSDFTTNSWGNPITGPIYDNIDNFFRSGASYDNTVSVSGGSKNGSFYLSASNFTQEGIVRGTSYEKTTFRFNGEQKYGILTVGANATYSKADTDKTLTSGGLYNFEGNGAMTALYGWPRSDDMTHWLNADGSKYRMFDGLQELASDTENPYWIINRNQLSDVTTRFSGGTYANVKILDWWDVTGRLGIDQYTNTADTYLGPGGAVKEMYQNGYLAQGQVKYEYLTASAMSNMQKTFGDFDFALLLGTSVEDTKRVRYNHWGYDFVTEGTVSFSNISDLNKFFVDRTTRKRMVAAFGEFRATYKNIAYLTVTGRNDWSSTLPKENRSYFYPSVSGSFVFTEVIPKNNILSFGKIRASWAQVGKDADIYATNTYLRNVAVLNGGTVGVGNDWTGGNPNLQPEIQNSYELGAELRFLNGRLTLDYTYYNTKTKNQLSAPRLAQSTGYIFITLNGGSVSNKGMEVSLTGRPIWTNDFKWEATLNVSGNRGRLGEFIDGVDIFYVTDAQIGNVRSGSIPNGGYFYGMTGNRILTETVPVQKVDSEGNTTTTYEELEGGRNQIDVTTGLYKDSNVTTNVVGNREPRMIGGLNNSFTYKNWNLSFLFDIRIGGDIYNGTEYYLVTKGLSERTLQRDAVSFSGVVNTGTAALPVWEERTVSYEADQMYNINGAMQSGRYLIQEYWQRYARDAKNFITDTNWLRLRSLSLSYDFTNLLKGQKVIKGLSATITGSNLLLFTNYKGIDPEIALSSGQGGSGSAGIEYCSVPPTASMSIGVNITF